MHFNQTVQRTGRGVAAYRERLLARSGLRSLAQRKKTMKTIFSLCIAVALLLVASSGAYGQELRMSLSDVYRVEETADWSIQVEKLLTLRFADVKITPKRGYDFNMKLFFKCDTPDLAQFDTPEKIATSVRTSSAPYLPYIEEKEIVLRPAPVEPMYGFLTILTDAEEARKKTHAPGQFKYMTRGMVRLSKDTALGFSLMTNDTDSQEYKKLLDYVYSFVRR